MKYKDLTPEQKKEICNGCGGKGGVIVPPEAIFFNASCNHHDFGYWKGGTWKDRLKCDNKLLKNMFKDSFNVKWYKIPYYTAWSFAYYSGVRAVGWKFFNYTKDETN